MCDAVTVLMSDIAMSTVTNVLMYNITIDDVPEQLLQLMMSQVFNLQLTCLIFQNIASICHHYDVAMYDITKP